MAKATTPCSPLQALVIGSVGVVAITLVLLPFHDGLNKAAPALLLLIPVVATAALGGRLAAAAVAIEAAFAYATGFLPPFGKLQIQLGHDIVALALFFVVAGAAGILIATVAESQRAQVASDEARIHALEQAEAERRALLRSVSHDLRTPLATIRAVATDLYGDVPFEPADRRELLGLVIDEVERLDRIVANLLSLGRIEAGAFLPDREAVDVADLVQSCVARLRRILGHVDLEVQVASDVPLLHVDYSQFDQVLSNLLENAVRHSPEGGEVLVSAAAADGGSNVRVQVVDRGDGFVPEVRDRLFEPFTTTGSTSSGVGLAICRSIIEAHGGTISASDTPGGGATLTVEVPVRA